MEEWRPIAGFPHYAVSSLGNVKRVAATPRYAMSGKCLRSEPGPSGYINVSVYDADGKHHSKGTHVLVCEAFHGPRPSGDHQVAHGDGDRANNRSDNLRWATRAENMGDKNIHGTMPRGDRHPSRTNPERLARGERNGSVKLTEDAVRQILADQRLNVAIARDFGVSKSTIAMIKRREIWRHVA